MNFDGRPSSRWTPINAPDSSRIMSRDSLLLLQEKKRKMFGRGSWPANASHFWPWPAISGHNQPFLKCTKFTYFVYIRSKQKQRVSQQQKRPKFAAKNCCHNLRLEKPCLQLLHNFFCCWRSLDLAMEAAQVNTVPCCRCKEVKEKVVKKQAGESAGSHHTQIICCDCHALSHRVSRMLKNLTDEENEGYKDMCSDTRRDFLKKAAGLCGPELKKVLTETITWSITHERAHSVKYEGDFMPVGDAEEK